MSKTTLGAVRRAAAQRKVAEDIFRQRVIRAHEAGDSLRAIGSAAGLSHVRIQQIVKDEREHRTWPTRDELRAEGVDPDTGVPYPK